MVGTVMRSGGGTGMLAQDAWQLLRKVEDRTANVCMVGLGYVGLTAACALAVRGYRVIGLDTNTERVRTVTQGICPFPSVEPILPELLGEQVARGQLQATSDPGAVAAADIVLVAVQTPVEPEHHQPQLNALREAVTTVGSHVRPGTLVVIESTIPPGTMRDLVVPSLEMASGLSATGEMFVACCPERVMPGRLLANLSTCSRVVGGWTLQAARVAGVLYRQLTTGTVDETDCITAELVKTVENAYRDVQIAFANEVALICESHAADVYRVRDLVNKSPFRAMHMPGAGVGGHCIPKDPWLLVANVDAGVQLVPAARALNDFMPRHVGELVETTLRAAGRRIEGARVAILGYAYLPDSDDTRNSPTSDVITWLEDRGAAVAVHDPWVRPYQTSLEQVVAGTDCLVLMVAHSAYRDLDLDGLGRRMRTRTVVDGRHAIDTAHALAAGFAYRCIGIGNEPPASAG